MVISVYGIICFLYAGMYCRIELICPSDVKVVISVYGIICFLYAGMYCRIELICPNDVTEIDTSTARESAINTVNDALEPFARGTNRANGVERTNAHNWTRNQTMQIPYTGACITGTQSF